MCILNYFSFLFLFISSVFTISCHDYKSNSLGETSKIESKILVEGKTVQTRYSLPLGFTRESAEPLSFTTYLRNLPLKPAGSKVKYYNGESKPSEGVYDAVIDMEISNKNLQQCADAVIRLRAEYLFKTNQFEKIHFNFTNGFLAEYSQWMQGKRIFVNGNNASWKKTKEPSNTYSNFRDYLECVFAYAGTLSLSKELTSVPISDIRPGDVFIKGGSPGHAVIVLDVAFNKNTNEKIFMIAQSYMPAQETQVLVNNNDSSLNPWYKMDASLPIKTPEWTFDSNQLMRFN